MLLLGKRQYIHKTLLLGERQYIHKTCDYSVKINIFISLLPAHKTGLFNAQ